MKEMFMALIIDDNPLWLKTLARLTGEAVYTILTAKAFEEALHTVEDSTPDLIITDIRLNDEDESNIDGLRLLMILHEREQLKASIVVTGYPNTEIRRAAEQLGAIYLEKGSFTREIFRSKKEKIKQASCFTSF